MTEVRLCAVSDVAPGEAKRFPIGRGGIALVRIDDRFYAIDDTCTHHGCSLADGHLAGSVVTCACHGSRFDVITGALVRGPAELPVRSYPVQVEGSEVKVEV